MNQLKRFHMIVFVISISCTAISCTDGHLIETAPLFLIGRDHKSIRHMEDVMWGIESIPMPGEKYMIR